MGCTPLTISISQCGSCSVGTCGEGRFHLIIHIFTHFKTAQAESFMKPFCVLPLNKYVNYWAQQLPQNMPLLWMSSPERSLTAYRRIKIKHMVTSVVHSHTPRLQLSFEPKRFLQLSVSGQAASLQLLAVMSGFQSGLRWRTPVWFKDEWWALLCFACNYWGWMHYFCLFNSQFFRCLLWTPISHKHNEKNEVISRVSGWSRCGQLKYGCNNRSIEKAEWRNNSNKLTKLH